MRVRGCKVTHRVRRSRARQQPVSVGGAWHILTMPSLNNGEPRSSGVIRYVESQEDQQLADKCECEIGCKCDAGSCHCKELRSRAEARNRVLTAYDFATSELKVAARKAVNDGMMKIEVARQANVTRRTLDAWLTERS